MMWRNQTCEGHDEIRADEGTSGDGGAEGGV